MNLWPHQEPVVTGSVHRLKKGLKPFIDVLGTGSGKSHVIAATVEELHEPTLILQPSIEILEQNFEKLELSGITNATKYSASARSKEISDFTFATIGSIKDYELFKHFRYVIVDECHVINPGKDSTMYMKFFDAVRPKGIMGLTASPFRITNRYHDDGAGGWYVTATVQMLNHIKPYIFGGGIAFKVEMKELMEAGYLCPIKYYINNPSTSHLKLKKSGADYTDDSLIIDEDLRKSQVIEAVKYCLKHHKKTLVYMTSVSGSNKLVQDLAALGISSETVNDKTPKELRREIVKRYKLGLNRVLINFGVFLVGFDVQDMDSIIWNRSTFNPCVYLQGAGRVVRRDPNNPNKLAHFYDLSGTCKRLGRVEDIRIIKQPGGWQDILICTPLGQKPRELTNAPLYTFHIK